MDPLEAERLVGALIRGESTLTLATVSGEGSPSAAPLFYLPGPGLSLHWLSSPTSRHSRNVLSSGPVAVAIFAATFSWREIRGVQMEGRVEVVAEGEERDRLTRAYGERFRLGETFREEVRTSWLYRFSPSWFRYVDNTRGFGFRVEGAPSPRPGHAP